MKRVFSFLVCSTLSFSVIAVETYPGSKDYEKFGAKAYIDYLTDKNELIPEEVGGQLTLLACRPHMPE